MDSHKIMKKSNNLCLVRIGKSALNSFAPTEMRRGVDRKFVETMIPLDTYNAGPGFVHYRAPGAML